MFIYTMTIYCSLNESPTAYCHQFWQMHYEHTPDLCVKILVKSCRELNLGCMINWTKDFNVEQHVAGRIAVQQSEPPYTNLLKTIREGNTNLFEHGILMEVERQALLMKYKAPETWKLAYDLCYNFGSQRVQLSSATLIRNLWCDTQLQQEIKTCDVPSNVVHRLGAHLPTPADWDCAHILGHAVGLMHLDTGTWNEAKDVCMSTPSEDEHGRIIELSVRLGRIWGCFGGLAMQLFFSKHKVARFLKEPMLAGPGKTLQIVKFDITSDSSHPNELKECFAYPPVGALACAMYTYLFNFYLLGVRETCGDSKPQNTSALIVCAFADGAYGFHELIKDVVSNNTRLRNPSLMRTSLLVQSCQHYKRDMFLVCTLGASSIAGYASIMGRGSNFYMPAIDKIQFSSLLRPRPVPIYANHMDTMDAIFRLSMLRAPLPTFDQEGTLVHGHIPR